MRGVQESEQQKGVEREAQCLAGNACIVPKDRMSFEEMIREVTMTEMQTLRIITVIGTNETSDWMTGKAYATTACTRLPLTSAAILSFRNAHCPLRHARKHSARTIGQHREDDRDAFKILGATI